MCYFSYFEQIACPPLQMVAEMASIVDGPHKMPKLIHNN